MPRAKSGRGLPKTGSAFEIGIQKTVRVRFDKLSEWEKYQYLGHSSKIKTILDAIEQESGTATIPSAPEEVPSDKPVPTHVTVERYIRKPGIKVEVPIHRYAWESYHSTESQSGGADYVAPSICDHLSLRNRGDSMDLYDASGNPASLFRLFGEQEYQKSDLIYLRRDLLEKYLTDTNKEIVWIIWGEREPRRSEFDTYREEVHEIWSSHGHIHKNYRIGLPKAENSSERPS